MKCLYCNFEDSKVVDSRSGEDNKSIRRRRECLNCHKRFSTFERLESLPLMVIKKNETREPFDPSKLRTSLLKACEKRPVSIDTIEKIVNEVEYSISNYVMEVSTTIIGQMALDKLTHLDTVSYLRFASVYHGFKTPQDFINAVKQLEIKVGKTKSNRGDHETTRNERKREQGRVSVRS